MPYRKPLLIARISVKTKKVGIAMSGGVDSTACALLLKEKFSVQGFFMRLAQPDFEKQRKRAENIADTLGIKLQVVDLRQKFAEKVLDYFSETYLAGQTPNPCLVCNREIKFGFFLDAIMAAEMDCVATGHYARIEKENSIFHLCKGADSHKDQSYFLARLKQEQLARIIFPLGEMKKEEAYEIVEIARTL